MADGDQVSELEREKLAIERLKVQLDYRKFVLGSVFVALAIAAIPPLFQLATAGLEYVKSTADRTAKQQAFRDEYIKEFVSNALNQDIELRIRFAQYFARVSTEPSRQDWVTYLGDLREARDQIRSQIDKMEAQWNTLASARIRDDAEITRLERNLNWAYKEVGYVEKNRSATVNPRSPEATPNPSSTFTPLLLSRFSDPVYFLTKPIGWKPKDQNSKLEQIEVPAGFVTDFASIPRVFWSIIRPDGEAAYPVVIHDYLYWTQKVSRQTADEILKQAMVDFGVDAKTVSVIYNAVRASGNNAWDENAKKKAQGEKRILKVFPTDARTSWAEWKTQPGVFAD
jgi:hypothetical protein